MPEESPLAEFLTHVGTRGFSRHKYLVVEDRAEAIATLADWFNGQADAGLGRRGISFFTDATGVSWGEPWAIKARRNERNCSNPQLMSRRAAAGHPLNPACWSCRFYAERPDADSAEVIVCPYQVQHIPQGGNEAAVFQGDTRGSLGIFAFYENASVVVIDFREWPRDGREVEFDRLTRTDDPVVAAFVAMAAELCRESVGNVEVSLDNLVREEPLRSLIADTIPERTEPRDDENEERFSPATFRTYLTSPAFETVMFEIGVDRPVLAQRVMVVKFLGDMALPTPKKLAKKAIVVIGPERSDVIQRLETIGVQQYIAIQPQPLGIRGPRRKLTTEQKAGITQLRSSGLTNAQIGELYGVHAKTVQRALKELRDQSTGAATVQLVYD